MLGPRALRPSVGALSGRNATRNNWVGDGGGAQDPGQVPPPARSGLSLSSARPAPALRGAGGASRPPPSRRPPLTKSSEQPYPARSLHTPARAPTDWKLPAAAWLPGGPTGQSPGPSCLRVLIAESGVLGVLGFCFALGPFTL